MRRLDGPEAGAEVRAGDPDVERMVRGILLERVAVLQQADEEAQRIARPDAQIGQGTPTSRMCVAAPRPTAAQ